MPSENFSHRNYGTSPCRWESVLKTSSPTPHLVRPEDLPRGITAVRALPQADLDALWDSIIVDDSIKDRLLSQAILNYTLRPKVPRDQFPMHGVILLVGPPGTGKTSLAKGLASKLASLMGKVKPRLVEVDPHALTSSAMGKTQRAVSELFSQTIAEQASNGPTIVLLDEVETLAADRGRMSLEANPIDIHRATDAVLVQLDALAECHTNILFLATSNFPQAIDDAFTSRCDLVIEVPPPGLQAVEQILEQCLGSLAHQFPGLSYLLKSNDLNKVAHACEGLDGRALRKMVINAMAMRREVASDPSKLTMADLLSAAKLSKAARAAKEAK
jgi:AAA+ superfamily predicted ATPase